MRLRRSLCAGLLASALLVSADAAADKPGTEGLRVPAPDRRAPAQTYLTYPEWFLVFSPAEYAALVRTDGPSSFPWFAHIGQFWSAYGRMVVATRGYPFNGQYHSMIVVIGTSTTVEYGLEGAYETLVGRFTELTARPNATPEDRLASREAQDYVDFIRVHPWYEFDFAARLKALWMQTPLRGSHPLRKWERRYLLTSEWGAKAIYGWLIGKATRTTYETPRETTLAIVRDLPHDMTVPGVRRLGQEGADALVELPRYQAFTTAATTLARNGARFEEIAGNRGTILVSQVVRVNEPNPSAAHMLMRQPILTRPGFERRVLEVPVSQLSKLLRESGPVEHAFDY